MPSLDGIRLSRRRLWRVGNRVGMGIPPPRKLNLLMVRHPMAMVKFLVDRGKTLIRHRHCQLLLGKVALLMVIMLRRFRTGIGYRIIRLPLSISGWVGILGTSD